MQEGTSAVHEDAWGAGYSDGGDGRPQSWPDAETLPDYEAGHAAGKEDASAALLGPWRTTAQTSPGSVPDPPPPECPLVDLQSETVGSRSRPRNRFRIIVGGETVGHVEAETSAAVRGIVLHGEPFGRYGNRILDHSIDTLLVKRSERRRLGETIRRIMGLPKDVEGL
ncbi:MAG: hypothetical protein F4139_00680 [Gemmatimonadetes bacterium]|nr:hypothetical protein [Gemmatimonadota bacterium]MYA65611.1 hypothetical protein [Gemmatimonadota bacterium]MYB99507.1 hypothetical protein [Gemmatimonadota bacterium]MYH51443.1 hypothetical protein [Gemmatimonadota bacterium]MYI47044.1 hypothetical protein [Gemmatimonadota bacterium]